MYTLRSSRPVKAGVAVAMLTLLTTAGCGGGGTSGTDGGGKPEESASADAKPEGPIAGDADGDGKGDLVLATDWETWHWLKAPVGPPPSPAASPSTGGFNAPSAASAGAASFEELEAPFKYHTAFEPILCDFDADGKADQAVPIKGDKKTQTNKYLVNYQSGKKSNIVPLPVADAYLTDSRFCGDFDGDDLPDMGFAESHQNKPGQHRIRVALQTAVGEFAAPTKWYEAQFKGDTKPKKLWDSTWDVGDFNGDGKDDALVSVSLDASMEEQEAGKMTYKAQAMLSNGKAFSADKHYIPGYQYIAFNADKAHPKGTRPISVGDLSFDPIAADVNGDGTDELGPDRDGWLERHLRVGREEVGPLGEQRDHPGPLGQRGGCTQEGGTDRYRHQR